MTYITVISILFNLILIAKLSSNKLLKRNIFLRSQLDFYKDECQKQEMKLIEYRKKLTNLGVDHEEI